MSALKKMSAFFSLFSWDERKNGSADKALMDADSMRAMPSTFKSMGDQYRQAKMEEEYFQERTAQFRISNNMVNAMELEDPTGSIIAFINDKGGVGKTTTAVNLAAALAVRADVLLIDLDRQGSATIALGHEPAKAATDTIAGVFEAHLPIETVIRPTGIDRVDFIPSGFGMTFIENKLKSPTFTELKEVLEPLRQKYRYILLDCQPTFTTLSGNAMVAADGCIVPINLDHLALAGLESLTDTFEQLHLAEDKLAPLLGVVLTMVDHQLPNTHGKLANIKRQYGDLVFDSAIHFDRQLAEAPASGKSIFDYAGGSRGARCYWSLSKEVIVRVRRAKQHRKERDTHDVAAVSA